MKNHILMKHMSLSSNRRRQFVVDLFLALTFLIAGSSVGVAQAALLIEQPYGFFRIVNPTGTARCISSVSARRLQ